MRIEASPRLRGLFLFTLATTLAFTGSAAIADPPVNGPGSTLSQAPVKAVPHTPRLPYGLQLMARPDLLPLLRDSQCMQDSSFDRSGGNGDSGHFVSMTGKTAVLSDIKGPGCIYRFWSANADGRLHIYFDGETTPRIDCPMQDLFLGKVAPFVTPIVGHKSGGWYCFFPMPFQKSVRIEVTDPGPMYYHVEFQRFSDDAKVRTFTVQQTPEDQVALRTVLAQWEHIGEPLVADSQDFKDVTMDRDMAPGTKREMTLPAGPATMTTLRARLEPSDRTTLRQVVVRVYWDGAANPAIEAPFGDLFGSDFGGVRFKSAALAATDDGYAMFWPAPYRKSARIVVENAGKSAAHVVLDAHVNPERRVSDETGYLHAQWTRQTTVAGTPFHILQTTGRGQYMGTHIAMQGDRGIWFLEGDESIYVDGSPSPSIQGTGTEDFFTGGWYFDEGPFNLPYHGCVVKSDDLSRIEAYRLQLGDCVPFQHDIHVDIEHGGQNDYPGADYACVAYWYQDTPEHTWSRIDPAQLTPATYHIPGVLEAESIDGVKSSQGEVKVVDATADDVSGGRLLEWRPQGDGDTLDLPISITDAGLYGAELGIVGGSADGRYDVAIDGKPVGNVDVSGVTGEVALRVTGTPSLDAGTHHLVLTSHAPSGASLRLDWVRLRKMKYPNSLEAENLKVLEAVTGNADVQEMQAFGKDWSSDKQLFFQPKSVGGQVSLQLPVDQAGKYKLVLYYTTAPDYGIVQALVDDHEIGDKTDLYSADVKTKPRTELGTLDLTAGNHKLTIRVVSKSADSRGYFVGIDAIGLEPVQ